VSVSKKNLPKVIRRTTDDTHPAVGGLAAMERQGAPGRLSMSGAADGGATALDLDLDLELGRVGDVIASGPAPQISSPPVTAVPARAAPTEGADVAARRRSLARSIVERHAAYAAVGGIIPLPIANVASITAVIVRMVKMLSDLYAVPFERDRARAIVIGMMGGAMPTGLAAVTTSTLVYIVPGSALIGLAVSSIAAIACTRGIGRIFVEHFENGATLQDVSALERG
jgi:uncharacterized protein (DUF697 family)